MGEMKGLPWLWRRLAFCSICKVRSQNPGSGTPKKHSCLRPKFPLTGQEPSSWELIVTPLGQFHSTRLRQARPDFLLHQPPIPSVE